MRLFVVLIMIIGFCGCTERKTQPAAFESIDYSFYVGYFASIKILSSGQAYIWHQSDWTKVNEYYSLTLDKPSLDSLSKMTIKLSDDNVDSVYMPSVSDHPISFCLIVKSNKRTISTKYYGGIELVKWKSLFNMATFLNDLCDKVSDHNDSTFVFKSKSRLILPPPPPALP